MNFLFMTFRLYLQKSIQPLSENFWLVLSKMQTGCPSEQIVGKLFLKKYKTFQDFPILSENVSVFGEKISAGLSKMQSRGTIWGEKLFLEKSYVPFSRFWTSSQTVWKLWWKYFDTMVEFAFYVSREESEKKSSWKRRFLFNYITLVKDLRLRAKTFR